MQTVLVTGGAGFIGSHLCEKLLEEGNNVICLDNLLTGSEKNLEAAIKNKNFRFIRHDITESFQETVKIDAIFHLASPASPNHHSKISYHALPMETMMVNTIGTKELLELAMKNNAKFLFASTSEVYGDPLEHPQKEEYRGNVSTTGPRSIYDESKRFGETITAYYWREKKVDSRIARIFNTYGDRMQKVDMRMIIIFINQALSHSPITIYGDGTQTRSLCFIDDMIEGLMRFMFYENTRSQVINLGSPEEHTVLEYAHLIKQITNSNSEIIFSEKLPEDDPKKRRPDIQKAKKLLNWEPKVSLEEGLKKAVAYYRSL